MQSRASSPGAAAPQARPADAPQRGRTALVLVARLPVPGKAKTRLAAGVGAESAADFYRQCAEHAFRQALSCPDVSPEVHCSEAAEAAAVAAWLRSAGCAMPVAPQLETPDFGARLLHALRLAAAGPGLPGGAATGCGADASAAAPAAAAASEAPPRAVVVAATDVPGLSPAALSAAAAALMTHDVVVGPAPDGGYYLIGLTAAALARPEAAALFGAGIPWSTAGVAAATRAAAAAAGLSVAPAGALPALRDIDTAQDLADWAREQERAQDRRRAEAKPALAGAGRRRCGRAARRRPLVLLRRAGGGAAHPLLPLARRLLESTFTGADACGFALAVGAV
ncbi:hypothetical protein Rsub_08669 [Raphidocelis subcapitata]|uniref:Glycosyltransferase n=1 Tax=Raphidocelis subcapitata TaxID=307507 RepID=A0A2V0PET0_9CHLO|nr:hypothetical protein Rsub_08669 [Raphidocelis subcapitata]|eukprot:GBF95687.1 hypothetical protein Rsub_08669 [Raphidocelis subcapitata]